MPKKKCKPNATSVEDIIAVTITVVVLSNGVLSALTGSWLPTVAALGLVVFVGWYGNR